MQKRAEALEETRNRIVWATMQLHGEKGVATTSQADVAARAGVAPATVYRHFPTLGSLVKACGSHVWTAVSPPRPEDAERLFAGLETTPERLRQFVEAVADFYGRAWLPLDGARKDRERVAELDEELRWVEAGLEALAREALALEEAEESKVQLVLALTDFGVWKSLRDHGFPPDVAARIMASLLDCALGRSYTIDRTAGTKAQNHGHSDAAPRHGEGSDAVDNRR
jgi:AcrR family transcriptional regulator